MALTFIQDDAFLVDVLEAETGEVTGDVVE